MTDRPRLGAKFAAPGIQRPAALAGLLATDPEPATTNRPEPPSAVVNGVAPPTARDRPVGTRGRGKATDRTSEQRWPAGNKIVPVVLDASILTELRAFANRTEQTQGNVALRAIEAHAEELQEHWRTQPVPPTGSLFVTNTQVHRRVEPGVQTQLRISPQDAATLDDLASEWGAPSRSALVNEALRRYVTTRQTREAASQT